MGYLVLAIFLLGIEVTRQFRHIPWENRQRTNDDYARCTVETIEKVRSIVDAMVNMRLYTDDIESDSATALIVKHFFNAKSPMSLVLSEPDELNTEETIPEKIGVAVADDVPFLRRVLDMLYRKMHHENYVVCVTYRCRNPVKNLSSITEEIWTSGVPRNVVFIVSNYDTEDTTIIGVPAYSKGNCFQTKLTKVGQYRKGNFDVQESGLYPRLDDLGGCELSVMVQPPILPYVERMEDSPGGIVGELMNVIGTSMNFTTRYVWSISVDDMTNHIFAKDLNLMLDMTPSSGITVTDFKFSVGFVRVAFVVPRRNKKRLWNKLLAPFDSSTWIVIASIFGILVLLSGFARGGDIGNIILKTFGTLLGVGVGKITTQRGWVKIFLWFWLLPAFILVQQYLARMTFDITIPIFVQDIRTTEELVNSELNVLCRAGLKRSFCKIGGPVFSKLCVKCRLVSDKTMWTYTIPYMLKTGDMNDTSVLFNMEFAEAYPAFQHIYPLQDHSTQVNQLAKVRHGSSWIFPLQTIFGYISASGLVNYWKRRHFDTTRRTEASNSIGVFRPEFAWCSFLLLIVGWIISFGCFLVELMLHRFINE